MNPLNLDSTSSIQENNPPAFQWGTYVQEPCINRNNVRMILYKSEFILQVNKIKGNNENVIMQYSNNSTVYYLMRKCLLQIVSPQIIINLHTTWHYTWNKALYLYTYC